MLKVNIFHTTLNWIEKPIAIEVVLELFPVSTSHFSPPEGQQQRRLLYFHLSQEESPHLPLFAGLVL